MTLAGATLSSTTNSIAFTKASGTYTYIVGSVTGYTASPSSGSATVSGIAVTQTITFTAVSSGPTISSFTVTPSPVELGLSVTFTVTATGGTGTLSYAYSGLPAGCTSMNAATLTCTRPETGSFTVSAAVTDTAGHTTEATVTLVTNPANAVFGLAPAVAYALIAAIAVVVAVAIAWFLVRARRKRQVLPGETPPPPPPPPLGV